MNLSEMRRNYAAQALDLGDLRPSPFTQFDHWMRQAIESELLEPNAMALATVGTDGQPTLRTVLLKGFDGNGFVFYTNYASTKVGQIDSNPGRTTVQNSASIRSDRIGQTYFKPLLRGEIIFWR